jgi:hypothetical protein
VTENNAESAWLPFNSVHLSEILSDNNVSWFDVQVSGNSGVVSLAREHLFVFESDTGDDQSSFSTDSDHLRFIATSEFGSAFVPGNVSVGSINKASEYSLVHLFSVLVFHATDEIGWTVENVQLANALSRTASDLDGT